MIEEVIKRFFTIILAPLSNLNVLWTLIPVYITWFLTDILAEREGLDPKDAIFNGLNAFWIGMDWTKELMGTIGLSISSFLANIPIFVITLFMIIWGITTIYLGIKKKWYVEFVGRTREISYAQITLTPLVYGMAPFDLTTLIAIISFFPLIYLIMEGVNRIFDKIFERMEIWGEEEW